MEGLFLSTQGGVSLSGLPFWSSTGTKRAGSTCPYSATVTFMEPVGARPHQLLQVKRTSPTVFSLNFQLGSGAGKVLGEQWKLEILKPGQCVTVWKAEGYPLSPQGTKCEIVGEHLKRSGPDRFWKSGFGVYYDDQLVDTCKKDQALCEIKFESHP